LDQWYCWVHSERSGVDAKTLEVLKAVPFENVQSLGELLGEAVKTGAKHQVEEGVRKVLNLGMKAIWWWGRNALTE
jgi:hypothetical protein